jgi:hypothetical protein
VLNFLNRYRRLGDGLWASYRYIVFADPKAGDGLHEIDFGAGPIQRPEVAE